MNKESALILEAYTLMGKPKVKDIKTATVIKEEESTADTPSTSGDIKVVKEEDDTIASETKSYFGFTGKIRTTKVYGTVENATFDIKPSGCVEFKKGTWLDGEWSGQLSFWHNGTWKNGTWKGGLFYNGIWENGTWQNGVFVDGTWKNGTWKNGTFDGGTWENGTWLDGEWEWKQATWVTGKDRDGAVHTDSPNKWAWKYSRVREVPKDERDQREVAGSGYRGEYKKGEPGIDTFDDDPNKEFATSSYKRGMKKGEADYAESAISECTKRILGGKGILGKMVNDVKFIKAKPVISEEDTETKEIEVSDEPVETVSDTETKEVTETDIGVIKSKICRRVEEMTEDEASDVLNYISDKYPKFD